VKPADPADPVFDGATGTIGDPVATALEPDPTPEPVATPELIAVPVAMGAVPVANPVEPATPVELMAAVLVHEQTWSKYVDVYTIGYGTELPEAEADVDPDEVADAVDDPDAELEDDEHDP